MKAAALDLGSNTLRLLVAQSGAGGLTILARQLAAPRLGQGLRPGGRLAAQAKAAAREHTRRFCQLARGLGAQRVALAATQACRIAADGADFVGELARELGLERARVLSGQQEAALSRLGTLAFLQGPAQGALLADVGGGSSELVDLGQSPAASLSLPLGAVSLSEALLHADPPTDRELAALDQAVEQGLSLPGSGGYNRLVASAGTASTLAALALGLKTYEPERINNLRVSRQRLEETYTALAALPLAQRRAALALDQGRADIILAGLAILRGLIRRLGLDELTVMDAGLLEGILLDDLANFGQGE